MNASVDAGYLGFQVMFTGLLSAVVTALAPVAVPIVIWLW